MRKSALFIFYFSFFGTMAQAAFLPLKAADYALIQSGANCSLITKDRAVIAIDDSQNVIVRTNEDEALILKPITNDKTFFWGNSSLKVFDYSAADSKFDKEIVRISELANGAHEIELIEPSTPMRVVQLHKVCRDL